MIDCLIWNVLVPPNLALPTVKTTLTTTPTLVPTKIGYAGYATGGSAFNIPNHGNIVAANFSFRVLSRIVTWPGAFASLVDKGSGIGRELSVFFDTSGNINFISFGAVAGGAIAVTTAMVAGGIFDLVITRAGSVATFYVNGASVGTSSIAAVTGTTAAAVPMSFGANPSGGGVNANAQYITTQIWNRALVAGEVLQLYRDPYCFLTWRQDRMRMGFATYAAFCTPQDAGRRVIKMVGY